MDFGIHHWIHIDARTQTQMWTNLFTEKTNPKSSFFNTTRAHARADMHIEIFRQSPNARNQSNFSPIVGENQRASESLAQKWKERISLLVIRLRGRRWIPITSQNLMFWCKHAKCRVYILIPDIASMHKKASMQTVVVYVTGNRLHLYIMWFFLWKKQIVSARCVLDSPATIYLWVKHARVYVCISIKNKRVHWRIVNLFLQISYIFKLNGTHCASTSILSSYYMVASVASLAKFFESSK